MIKLSKTIPLLLCFINLLNLLWFSSCSKNDSATKTDSGLGTVTKQDITQKISAGGNVDPLRKTIITAPYNGYLRKLFVQLGQEVNANDPLLIITQSLNNGDNNFPVRAPYRGKVVQVRHNEGAFVKEADATDYIIRIDDFSKMFVIATIPEVDRSKIKMGMNVLIKATALNDKKYNGIIRELALAPETRDRWEKNTLSDYLIRIEITNKDEAILPGMSVIFDIIVNQKSNILTIPHEYVYKDESSKYYVITKDNQKKFIEVGIQNDEMLEIKSGLSEGEKLQLVDFSKLIKE
ncbi:MAG: efflux RND transporter periplasmic adaptor subunit [Oligoflexia bacterium]|nr:efflux RND transporter periplasmic adaptor subunit [Oligoflexia bacterium]MBF0364355.1 efflux RND transporter periplasmic adaptor subunit [Oligoflexia bacterium]